jgi:diguanylate cyclase (GGDEF)-like protein
MNDRRGHMAGDQMLVAAAQVMRTYFRTNDVVSRIGGDEFAVLLPGANESASLVAVQRLRLELDRYNDSHPDLQLSVSLGSATTTHQDRPEELMRLADNRMYEDKRTRNTHYRTGSR